MVRQMRSTRGQDSAVEIDGPNVVRESLRAQSGAEAAAEVADVLVVLRSRAVEFDLGFLCYLLEMAYMEAFEQSQNGNPTS